MSKVPIVKQLLQWAEDFRKSVITTEHVDMLEPFMDESPRVVNHLIWGYLALNLTGLAHDIFANVEEFNGLEVWRRLVQKIDDRSERRRDELKDAIEKPKGASKFEDVGQVIENWDKPATEGP